MFGFFNKKKIERPEPCRDDQWEDLVDGPLGGG